jgi:hypothetical protein
MSYPKQVATTTITAQATFTDYIPVRAGELIAVGGHGPFTATLTPQCLPFDNADTVPFDFGADTVNAADVIKVITAPTSGRYRVGVKTGGYGSGTIVAKIASGG